MNNYEKLDRFRLTADHIRIIKNSLTQAWGKLFVAANLLNQSPEFQRVSFDPTRNTHFRVTRAWLKDAVNRFPELRLAQLDAEESMLDMVEFQAIQQAIGTKTPDGKVVKPNFQAIEFLLTTQGKKRGYGFTEPEDAKSFIHTRIVEILNQATPEAIIQISKIPEFNSVTKRLKPVKPAQEPQELSQQATEATEPIQEQQTRSDHEETENK